MTYSIDNCIGVIIAFLVLTWITALPRFYTRIVLVKKFWYDDGLALISLILFTVYSAFYLNGLYTGILGRHIAEIADAKKIEGGLLKIYESELLYTWGIGAIKIGFGLTLLRLLHNRYQLLLLYFTMAIIIIGQIFVTFFLTFFCTPVEYTWTRALDPYVILQAEGADPDALGFKPKGKCHDPQGLVDEGYLQVALMIWSDLVLGIVLPVLLLKDLNMRIGLRITAGIILAIGSSASIGSIIRAPYLGDIAGDDIFFTGQPIFLWGSIEWALCLIATSCATLKPLYNWMTANSSNDPNAFNTEDQRVYALEKRRRPKVRSLFHISRTEHTWKGDTTSKPDLAAPDRDNDVDIETGSASSAERTRDYKSEVHEINGMNNS